MESSSQPPSNPRPNLLEMALAVLIVIATLAALVFGFNKLQCNPVKNVLAALLPHVAVAPVTEMVIPGSEIVYGRNSVTVKPPRGKIGTGKKVEKPHSIWHPVELKPWVDSRNILHVPQSGFCLVPLGGAKLNLSGEFYWEAALRVFVAGQLGLQPTANDRGWGPKIGWRLFDSNILLSGGPDFKGLSFGLDGASISIDFDPGFWL